MPQVEAIALTDFVHNDITASDGKVVRHRDGSLISASLAADLEKHNLVRVRTTPSVAQPAAPGAAGKAADDGRAQPSSALPAGQASTTQTSSTLKVGGTKTGKAAT